MYKQYALTQVCSIHLTKHEIEQMLVAQLLALGGDPSYDFERSHPIFAWHDNGELSIRFVQSAVLCPEGRNWLSLKPVPTEHEIRKRIDEAIAKAKSP